MSETHEGANDTPCEGESWKPEPWGREFERNITWDLKQDATDVVDRQCREVLVSG